MSGIPGWARVGAKVVCVDDGDAPALTADAIYTITGIAFGWQGVGFLVLAELPEHLRDGWFFSRFRPLITQQDDIETHFKALLDVPEQVGV